MKDKNRLVKCEGRFHELREYLFNDALPLVMEEETTVSNDKLDNLWDLVKEDVLSFDFKDPYFESGVDSLRKKPILNSRSLLPLLEAPSYNPDMQLVERYLKDMGNSRKISEIFSTLVDHPREFVRRTLERESRKIILPNGKNLAGYVISGNFGIGTIAQGGIDGGGIRSDSPFLLEVYQEKSTARGEFNLAALIGFWLQDNSILVSQMQSCRNAKLPEGVPFGVGCLTIVEAIGKGAGCENVLVYNAKGHPLFHEHPDNWKQLSNTFVCEWDGSAKKLGYVGSRNSHYEKSL